MKHPETPLVRRLRHVGITLAERPDQGQPDVPWFVKVLLAVSGWLAALMIVGFVGLAMTTVIDSGAASLALGGVLLAVAYGLLRVSGNDFIEHLALAISLAGQLLIAWALIAVLRLDDIGMWWLLTLLQSCLALLMPSRVHRVFSTFAASLAGYFALATMGLPYLLNGLVLVGLVWVWLNELRWLKHMRTMQAWGYGLVLGLIAMQLMAQLGHPWDGGAGSLYPRQNTWLSAWSGELLATSALLLLTRQLLNRSARRVPRSVQLTAYASALLLLPLSLFAFGLTQGALIVVLGFAIANQLLLGLGVISLLFSITAYYYLLDATLLTKALTLLLLGGMLLILRWWLRRQGLVGEGGGNA